MHDLEQCFVVGCTDLVQKNVAKDTAKGTTWSSGKKWIGNKNCDGGSIMSCGSIETNHLRAAPMHVDVVGIAVVLGIGVESSPETIVEDMS